MRRYIFVSVAVWAATAAACSDSAASPVEKSKPQVATDAPKLEAVRFEMEPVTIEPGTEAMHCYFMPPLERDLVVRGFATTQAPGGHHFVIYRSITQKPAGTVEDCSTGESMSNLMLVLTQTGTQEPGASAIEFPEEHVMVLKAGMQLVGQSHYINVTEKPFQTKDSLRIDHTHEDLAKLTQLHLFVAAANGFEIPPSTEEYSASAGCVLAHDIKLLSLAPHMHEWGKRIELRIGDATDMRPIMQEPNWKADMRDLPPITSYSGPGAKLDGRHKTGQSVAITCTWQNDGDKAVKFPQEMCAAVGYFTSDAPDAADALCIGALP